jgi:hypothetical protein
MERKRKPGEAPGAPDPASLGEDRKARPSNKDQVEGEGSYSGTKDYNARTGEFLKSGKVDEAARKAAPQSEEEANAMRKAERMGKERAKGEDPALRNPDKMKDDPKFPRK